MPEVFDGRVVANIVCDNLNMINHGVRGHSYHVTVVPQSLRVMVAPKVVKSDAAPRTYTDAEILDLARA